MFGLKDEKDTIFLLNEGQEGGIFFKTKEQAGCRTLMKLPGVNSAVEKYSMFRIFENKSFS